MFEIKMNLEHTLLCGQVFRFTKEKNGYRVFSGNKTALCTQEGDLCRVETDDEPYFYKYFDSDTDYEKVIREVSRDKTVAPLAQKYRGLRLLKQDLWEMTISFIISQNNNIPRIQGIVERLCENFGQKTEFGYAFPMPSELCVLKKEDLAVLRSGYRDSYILDASIRFAENSVDTECILKGNIKSAREELYKIKGIGPKVADCILLFGAGRMDAFPVDTWMRKALFSAYGIEITSPEALRKFADEKFGEYAGFAQQYLFFGARNGDI